MNNIKIEIFGHEAECLAFTGAPDAGICFELGGDISGFLSLDGVTKRVEGGVCTFDTRNLPDGEYEPILILERLTVKLPKIKKAARKIRLAECADDYIRRVSVRERRLALRVSELERQLAALYDKIAASAVLKFN